MNCSPELIGAYMDGELDAGQLAAVQQHISECAGCAGVFDELQAQRDSLRSGAPYYRAPQDLRARLEQQLRREAGPQAAFPWRAWAVAASLLLAASVAWNVLQVRTPGFEATVVDDHIRSLIGTHLIDVVSSDQHTIKPWFAGQLEFSPKVLDLSADGFPLAGGRVDYLAGKRVAAMVYHRRQHVINLFTWPGNAPEGQFSKDGFHVLHWNGGGMNYWAVSDVSPDELLRLRSLYEK